MSTPLSQGSRGPDVVALQRALTEAGWYCRPDGAFGPITQAATKAYQHEHGLPDTGIADDATLADLGLATIWGVDVSEFNAPDWPALAAAGCAFAIVRIGTGADRDGIMREDHAFRRHMAGARAVGIEVVAGYWWGSETRDGAEQARFCRDLAGDLGVAYDHEPANGATFHDHPRAVAVADAFLAEVPGALIYTGPFCAPFPPSWASRWLWLAHPAPSWPAAPAPWTEATIWQSGVKNIDRDVYRGTLEGLRAIFSGSS